MTFFENSKYLRKDVAEKYNRYIPDYYFFDFKTKKYINELDLITSLMQNKHYHSTLELGIGTGRVTKIIRPFSKEYTGIDVSESMIREVKKIYGQGNEKLFVSGINEFISNMSSLEQYDFICSFWSFNYAILSFFEYYDLKKKKHVAYNNLEKSENRAICQINLFLIKWRKEQSF